MKHPAGAREGGLLVRPEAERAGSSERAEPALPGAADWKGSARAAWAPFWLSRLAVFAAAIWITVSRLPPNGMTEYPQLSKPFGSWPATGLLELIFSPLAKWDAVHYLAIATHGYAATGPNLPPQAQRPAYFPLYPEVLHILSGFGSSGGLALIMGYAVSLVCFFGVLVLLHRLTTIELGERYARPALMLFAFFPTAMFYGIPYTESMFLLFAVGAFLAAREGRWAIVGMALALATATRAVGLLLLIPITLLYLYGPRADREPVASRGLRPRYHVRPQAAWLLLAPVGIIAFSIYLHFKLGDALAWQHAEYAFGRRTVDPFTGLWVGLREAGKGFAHVVKGTYNQGTIYDGLNIAQVAFVAFGVVGGVGALRRLPAAYGTWVLISLLPILTSQPPEFPFMSAARYVGVLFPIYLWLAVVCERRRWTTAVVALFATGMAVFTIQFTLWSFVA